MLAALALLFCAALAPAAARAEAALRVMALGDSVTLGTGSSHGAGYRLEFWNRLHAEGYAVDMVGGKAGGPDTIDNRHQAYEKGTLFDLNADVVEKVRRYQPDVVLLLTGSDECRTQGFSPRSFAVNLGILMDRIQTAKHGVKIFVATLPPNRFGRKQDAKLQVNALVRRAVKERAARGEAVVLVDVFPLLDPDRDMLDAQRPNDAGYEKIGDAFADALLVMLGKDVAG